MESSEKFTLLENFYFKYLSVALRNYKLLTYNDVARIFLNVLKDYLDGNTSTNDLSMAATQLYFDLKPGDYEINAFARDLGEALETATEIDYVFQGIEKGQHVQDEFNEQLEILKKFYEKYKSLLQ